jgi:hypothetical protein
VLGGLCAQDQVVRAQAQPARRVHRSAVAHVGITFPCALGTITASFSLTAAFTKNQLACCSLAKH